MMPQRPRDRRWDFATARFADAAALAAWLVRSGADASTLVGLLDHHRAPVRLAAALGLRLGDFPLDAPTVDALLAAIDDPHGRVVVAAIRTLGAKRAWEAREELLDCVEMTQPEIQAAALEALVALGTDELEPIVRRHLESDVPVLVRSASRAIAHQRLDDLRPALIAVLQAHRSLAVTDAKPGMLWIAALRAVIDALAVLGAHEAVPLLTELATSHFGLRSSALEALQQLGVPIEALAEEALRKRPSRHMRTLVNRAAGPGAVARVDPAHQGPLNRPSTAPYGPGDASSRTETLWARNRLRLAELEEQFDREQLRPGHVELVTRDFAIVRLESGVAARIDCEEVSWQPVRDLRRVLARDQSLTVQVLSVDLESGAVRASLRGARPDPWPEVVERLVPGTTVRGRIDSVAGFGLFVMLQPDVVGLVHRSLLEIPPDRHLADAYTAGQSIDVRVLEVSIEDRRIRLAPAE